MPDQSPVKPKQTRIRISDEMRRCVEIMAHEGLPLHMAAARANIHRDTATRNMRKAHVLELFNQMVHDVRVSASQAAYMRMVHMSTHADSERVRLDATKPIAKSTGKPDQRRRDNKTTLGNTPSLKPSKSSKPPQKNDTG